MFTTTTESASTPVRWLTEPLSYGFFRYGLVAAALSGGLCGIVGVYVVLRRMSYIGHGLSHAIFGGAVAGYLLGPGIYAGAAVFGVGCALAIAWISRRRIVSSDAAIGIVSTASFAVGVALISAQRGFTRSFDATLFGNVLAVGKSDLAILAGAALLTAASILAFYRPLLFTVFDEEVARASGIRTGVVEAIFAVMLSSVLIASMQILGVTLVAAAVVIPPATARMLTSSFGKLLVVSAMLGTLCGLVGMYTSYHLDVSSGSTIVLASASVFAVIAAGKAVLARIRRSLLPVRLTEVEATRGHRSTVGPPFVDSAPKGPRPQSSIGEMAHGSNSRRSRPYRSRLLR